MVIRHNDIMIDRANQSITIGEYTAYFPQRYSHYQDAKGTSVAFKIFEHLLLKGEMSREQMFEHIYGHCPDGGPENGKHIFDIHFGHWLKHFEALRVKLVRDKRGGTMYLKLRKA